MYLIVGLGNPGLQYADTRHNVGFMLLDQLAAELGLKFSRHQFLALYTDGPFEGHKIILAKPQTFMNLSGNSIIAVKKFYKMEEVVVIHDDLDLPFGTLRFKKGGGHGGHVQ